jgi:hypothetical protein
MADGVKDAVASTPHLRQILAIRQEKPAGGQSALPLRIDYCFIFTFDFSHPCWCRLHDKRDVPPWDVHEGGQRHR